MGIQEHEMNNNREFDASSVLGFRTKEKFYVVDYILTKPD